MDLPSIPAVKRCTKCGKEYPATSDYFSPEKRAASGLVAACRECETLRFEQLRRKRGQKVRKKGIVSNGTRFCIECKRGLPETSEYYRQLKSGSFRGKCRDCERESSRKWRQNLTPDQREGRREYMRVYDQTPKRKAYNSDLNERRKTDPNRKAYLKRRASDLDFQAKRKGYNKEYCSRPEVKERKRIFEALRRTSDAGVGEYSEDDWEAALAYFGNKCAVCGRSADEWTVIAADHWIPRSKGGLTARSNIVPLCHTRRRYHAEGKGCNNSKYNKMPLEWLSEYFSDDAQRIQARIQTYFDSLT